VAAIIDHCGLCNKWSIGPNHICCWICRQEYVKEAGHSCSDTDRTKSFIEKWKAEKAAKEAAQQELKELEDWLLPLAKHHAGEYNRWRQEKANKSKPGWIEALDRITSYLRNKLRHRETTETTPT
jgi:hypothetical protein